MRGGASVFEGQLSHAAGSIRLSRAKETRYADDPDPHAPGRTDEEKRACLKAIHEAVTSTLGVPDSAVRAWITDMDPHAFIRARRDRRRRAGRQVA